MVRSTSRDRRDYGRTYRRQDRNSLDSRDDNRKVSRRSRSGGRLSNSTPTKENSATKREISTSRERSRERERRRRKMQAECIRRAGGFQKLADSEGKEPVRLFWDGFQWVAKTGHSTALQNDPALMNSTRKLRRLYFGNLPLHMGLTESLFQELVWIEMKNRGICNDPSQQPVLCVWFAKDKGNYGFVEFASVEETNRALEKLDGMMCMGVALKVSRPNDYATVAPGAIPNGHAGVLPGAPTIPGAAMTAATARVVRFCEMVMETDLEAEESWDDFLDDVRNGCSTHGTITSAVIVTPEKQGDCPYGVGDVFLEFSNALEAAACISGMTGRRYLERPVTVMGIEDVVYNQLVKPLMSSCEVADSAKLVTENLAESATNIATAPNSHVSE